ncbi:response regulator transcription factor [Sphingomonas panaciterrae]|uniref:response regulator transcription factor n=1 Tax=Sphingomonas panaciterrae TaxID=1462999 RepID=UPI0011A5AB01
MSIELPVYIIDDEPEVCRSLALLMAAGGIPARSFGNADLFLDLVHHLAPGIVICDVVMPGTSGIELLQSMRSNGRQDPVILIAGHADIPIVVAAMQAGATNFLEKPFDPDVIIDAVALARQSLNRASVNDSLADRLSPRERQVLELVIGGATSKEAARHLGISPRTVETYRTKLLEKTGARSTAHLVKIGLEAGLGSERHSNVGSA